MGRGNNKRHDEGVHYLTAEELAPFPSEPTEKYTLGLLKRLDNSEEWSAQFGGIDDARRLVRHAPKLLPNGGHLRKLVSLITSLADSLRSALAKNALRCLGELFAVYGKRMDIELDMSLPIVMKRAADTNIFIAEEADVSLQRLCRHATEAKLMRPLLNLVASKQVGIRCRSAWCMAMLLQRFGARGRAAERELRGLAETVCKVLVDASPEVRLQGRVAATVLVGTGVLEDGPQTEKLYSAALPGVDLAGFDAFDIEGIQRCSEMLCNATAAPRRNH